MDILVQPNALPVSVQIADICCIKYSGEQAMPTEIYMEALLVDEELADQVWEAWNAENLTDGAAYIAWLLIAGLVSARNH